MKKILKYLSLLLPFAVAFAIPLAVGIILGFVYVQSYFDLYFFLRFTHKIGNTNILDFLTTMPELPKSLFNSVEYILQIIWAVAFFIWYRCLPKYENKVKLVKVKNLILLFLISVGWVFATTGLMDIILPYFEKLTQEYDELMKMMVEGNSILVFISTVILAPISEELIFRGVIMKRASQFAPFFVANILQALMFGIMHLNIVQGSYAFIGGLAMGYAAYRYKSVIASMIIHMFFNASNYVFTAPSGGYYDIIYIAVGTFVMLLALFLVKKVTDKEGNLPADLRDRQAMN